MKYLNLEHNNITSVPHLRLLEPNTNKFRSTYSHPEEILTASNFNEVIDEEIEDVNSKISILEEILYNTNKTENAPGRNDVIETECSQGHLQGNVVCFHI